jgi:hypothetical protein
MLRSPGLVAMVLVIAGCSVAVPPSSAPPESTVPGMPTPPGATIEPLPPLDPDVMGLTCGDGPAFHPALLDGPGRAEAEGDAAAAALRDYVARQGESGLPPRGWTRVAQTADYVQFVAPGRFESGWAILAFQLRAGRWEMAVAGQCRLGPNLPQGVSLAKWRLDPAFPRPGPDDRTIHVLLTEQACASAQSPEGRVLPPTIITGPDRVTITILVRNTPGGADCPGNPEFATPIELEEPLGGRPLFDAGTFPPTGPVVSYALTCEFEGEACRTRAAAIVAEAERGRPGRRVAWLSLYDVEGGFFDLGFDDGTSLNRHP